MLFSLYFQLCLGVMICLEICISFGERTFMNQFAVRVDGGKEVADKIAAKHDFVNLGQIGSLSGYYLFEHNHISKRSLESSHHHHKKLISEPQVTWAEQQVELRRTKRDHIYSEYGPLGRGLLKFRSKVGSRPSSHNTYSGVFTDPLYSEQWYLHGGAVDGWDMDVIGAWKKGFTGKGVVVSILDDGIQTNHPDLIQNYDPLASTDINGNDDDPMPQDNGDNKHGTRCAGEVAATAYNNICGVGIAYNSSIGGVRMLDGTVNDAVEARALSLNPNHIDIYSASWGPEDDGKTVDGPGPLARRAFLDGVTMGRKGKGSIFVWASGNGGRHTDNCNCDGYTNSIFTLSISSVTQRGLKPWYLEECSSTLATTYSSGTPGHDKNIVTVDMDPRYNSDTMCTRDHTGTSASAPIAAAICALALEANPNLTWRDMQYLVVLTSRPEPLEKEDGWSMNGVRRKVSHKFGYGLMDAAEMTTLAQNWSPVPPQHICETHEDLYQREIPSGYGEKLEIYMDTDACWNTPNVVNYLEHVQAKLTIRYNPRGNLKIILVSPSGTRSVLLFPRPRDLYQTGFDDWPFLSVHFWGEKAAGRWKLTIINAGSAAVQEPGILKKWSLIFHGTEQNPNRRSRPRSDPPQFAASSISSSMAELQNKDCHEECLDGCFGKGADLCKECRHFKMEGSPRVCVKSCSEGYFASKNLCQPCDPSCKTCSDGNSNNCLSCVDGLLFVEGTNECVKDCPSGYYLDEVQKTCFHCSPVCNNCSKASNNCTSCRSGLFSYGSSCMAACPKKTFEGEKQKCLPCHDLCETCMGALPSECVTCPRNLVHLNGTCLEACPDGYYSDAIVNECYSCDPICQTCNKTQCLTCQKDWLLDSKGVCRRKSDECSQGHYANGDKCLPCHISCENCNGPAYSQCLSCPVGRFLYKNTCIEKCPPNTFSTNNRECIQCHETCITCTGSAATQCKTCKKGLQLHNSLCTTACGERYYAEGGLCKPCQSSCLTCNGPEENQCITCPPELQLVEGKCQKSCPDGFFAKDGACYSCHHTCLTCKGNGLHDCLSCHSNYVLDDGICIECAPGQFYDQIMQSCRPCDPSCRNCNGPDKYSCLSCAQPLKHDHINHRCVWCCDEDHIEDCCHCDQLTDTCISVLNTDKRTLNPVKDDGSLIQAQNYFKTFGIAAALTCAIGIIVFLAIFAVLQTRGNNRCSTKGYQRLPMRYEFRKIELSAEDLLENEEFIST